MNYSVNENEKYNFCPSRTRIIELLNSIKKILFPGYFDCNFDTLKYPYVMIEYIKSILEEQLKLVTILSNRKIDIKKTVNEFIIELENLPSILKTDLHASFEGDPASVDYNEIIISYPGFFATTIYRIAHILYKLGVVYIPRVMTEYAHSQTGIDIHPGATIGSFFFIDHGTGVVIGQTAVIGNQVRIYQGVTIGALSLGRGQKVKGGKRHPTIGDNVIIYAGATILGGDTVIGNNVTIGSNSFITESIADNSIVKPNDNKQIVIVKDNS